MDASLRPTFGEHTPPSPPTHGRWCSTSTATVCPSSSCRRATASSSSTARPARSKPTCSYDDIGYPEYEPSLCIDSSSLTPLVIDADGDGHAEVVFNIISPYYPLNGWVVALKSANDDWQPARPVWNQFAMHDANVTDTGHIPYPEANNFATPRTNVFANPARIAPAVDPRKREQATFTYKAQAGGLDSNAATVTIDIMPPNRPPVFTSTPPTTYITYYAYNAIRLCSVCLPGACQSIPTRATRYLLDRLCGAAEATTFVIDPPPAGSDRATSCLGASRWCVEDVRHCRDRQLRRVGLPDVQAAPEHGTVVGARRRRPVEGRVPTRRWRPPASPRAP